MWKDPLFNPQMFWPQGYPYDILADFGLTPNSTQAEILDASFDIMASGSMNEAVRTAWDELRRIERRQLVDFFLYQLADEPSASEALDAPDPNPVDLIDLESWRVWEREFNRWPLPDGRWLRFEV